ncbi:uncharacterized protein LOC135627833 isoform X1 [Musa acuminata AAA Group]|uniref:uncharacterized protein LOC135627833 isoform X1 n=1 Tax=Musa acuminata AAA Group TaxID=214697 RepID=UPI0031D4F392
MEVAFSSPRMISGDARILSRSSRSSGRPAPKRVAVSRPPSASAGVSSSSSSSRPSSLSCGLVAAPFVCGSVHGDFNGLKIRVPSLKPPALSHSRRPTRGVVSMGGEKLGYETEAFAIYDVMRFKRLLTHTLMEEDMA